MIRTRILVSALLLVSAVGSAGTSRLIASDGRRPAVAETIASWSDTPLLVAITTDGLQAAALVSDPPQGHQVVIVEVGRQSQPALPVEGQIRDLLFVGDPPVLFALEHRPAKHRVGETALLRFDPQRSKFRRVLSLTASARALVYWPAEQALLVPSKDALRTILLPGLTSGPIYRVVGDNLAACAVGGSRFLVGQSDRLIELDLADRPGRNEMPRREELLTRNAVQRLAPTLDGSKVWAEIGDQRLLQVSRAPLRLDGPAVEGILVYRDVGPAVAMRGSVTPSPAEPATPVPQPTAPRMKARPTNRPATVAPAQPLAAPPAPPQPSYLTAQLRGRLIGPAATEVVFIVLRGPDNLLREAARLRPDTLGRFFADNLAAGRYKIDPDAGASRVLVTRPPFFMVEVPSEGSIVVPDLQVLSVR